MIMTFKICKREYNARKESGAIGSWNVKTKSAQLLSCFNKDYWFFKFVSSSHELGIDWKEGHKNQSSSNKNAHVRH